MFILSITPGDESMNQEESTDNSKVALQRIIDEAVSFYISLINQLQEKYDVNIQEFINNSSKIAHIRRKVSSSFRIHVKNKNYSII